MQPRRDTQHTPYGETQNPAEDRLEEEAYQPVKPVGYEARLAFEQERASDARQGRTGRRHLSIPVRRPMAPGGLMRRRTGPRPGQPRGQAPYTAASQPCGRLAPARRTASRL